MKFSHLIVLGTLVFTQTFAAEAPLKVSAKFNLSGKETFFQLMSKPTGVKAALDRDYPGSFEIADVKTFRERASNFDHIAKLESKVGGEAGMDTLVSKLAGQVVTEDQMYGKIMSASNGLYKGKPEFKSRFAGALAPVLGIISGKGVLVQLDAENYCYNWGYAKGSGGKDVEQDKMERRTGRSYGASITRGAYDPSDNDYLKALSAYAANASDAELKKFYTVIFNILLKTDSRGLSSLSEEGQTVVADFMAIYMAELDRHLMTGLTRYEWENALTEITMLGAYSTHDQGKTFDPTGDVATTAGRTTTDSAPIPEGTRLVGFFGVGTDGSGLDGQNKKYRHALTKQIVNAERKLNPELVSKIESLIGSKAGVDIYDQTMEVVNSYNGQARIRKNANELIKTLVEFVMTTRKDAAKISAMVN